jgi:hypothetical protein
MLFDIDFEQDKLYMQNLMTEVCSLLENLGNFEGTGDMDITADNSTALAVTNNNVLLFTNLTTGKTVNVSSFLHK